MKTTFVTTILFTLGFLNSALAAPTASEERCLLKLDNGLFEPCPPAAGGIKRDALPAAGPEDRYLAKREDGLWERVPQCGFYCKRDDSEDSCLVRRDNGLYARLPKCPP